MSDAAASPSLATEYVWRAEGFDPEAYSGAHALVPISLGLALPALVLVYMVPDLVAYWALMLGLYLFVIFVLTAAIFLRSIFRTETIAEVRFNARNKVVNVTRMGNFGNTVDFIAFDKIADAYLHVRYDDDGYKVSEPRIRLKSGEDINLPGDVSIAELDAVRRLIKAA